MLFYDDVFRAYLNHIEGGATASAAASAAIIAELGLPVHTAQRTRRCLLGFAVLALYSASTAPAAARRLIEPRAVAAVQRVIVRLNESGGVNGVELSP